MKYKGYIGHVTYDEDAKIFHGEVIGLKDVITFQGESVKELEQAFKDSINDYLEFCQERGENPEKTFSGSVHTKPVELNWVTPYLTVVDAQKSLEFYTTLFGFTEHQRLTNKNGKILFARITYNGCNIIFSPHKPFTGEMDAGPAPILAGTPSPVRLYVYCSDIEERYQTACDNKLVILMPLGLRFWGDTTFRVQDLDGYIWDFAQKVAEFDAQLLPPELI